MVDCERISNFFSSELGRKLCSGQVLREFKFSILDDGDKYGGELAGEKVLLQGVVDCALIEPDGITVLDFKTDRVTEQGLYELAQHYKPQVDAYAQALQRICQAPVKEKYLYFFRLERLVRVD